MKIVIVSTNEVDGGAAKAANRLHKSLLENQIDSTMVVQFGTTNDPTVLKMYTQAESSKRNICDKKKVLTYSNRTKTLFSISNIDSMRIVNKINSLKPDIVNLHWVASGMIRIEDLPKIKSHIVWNCHDMFAFTGGCHYDEHCDRYKKSCGHCKVLGSNIDDDLSKDNFYRKLNAYKEINSLTFIGTSKWMTNCLTLSPISNTNKILNIPSGADARIFQAMDKILCRNMLNLPVDKKIILFGAMNPLGDPRKGSKELLDTMAILDIKNTILVVAGSFKMDDNIKLKYPVYFIPPLKDEVSLSIMYNVADVMIVPSLQENLANTIVESLLCSVPVVAFDIDGNKDMIIHKKNGYLVKPYSVVDLAEGIKWVLESKNYNELALNARAYAYEKFDISILALRYIETYKNILKGKIKFSNSHDFANATNPSKCIASEYYNEPLFYDILLDIIKNDEQCIVYGAGTVSKTINAIMPNNIILFVDNKSDILKITSKSDKIYNPKIIPNLTYDKIIVSVLGRENEIKKYLVDELKVDNNKIILLTDND